MDSERRATGVNTKPSGLPRLSRLPVLNNKSSQVIPSRQDANEPLHRPTKALPKLQKRKSNAALLPTDLSSNKCPISTRTGNTPGSATSSRGSSVRPSSRGNQQRKPPPSAKSAQTPEDEENHDQLGSLDSFRSASRQGSQDVSPPEPQKFREFTELPMMSRDRKPSRPSLSDRTIESLQHLPATPKDRRRSSFFSPESPMGPPPRPGSSMSRTGSNTSSRPGTSDGSFARALERPPSAAAKKAPASAKLASRTSLGGFGFTPGRSVSSTLAGERQSKRDPGPKFIRSPSPVKQPATATYSNGARRAKIPLGSKTVSAKLPKPRSALTEAFRPAVKAGTALDQHATNRDSPSQTSRAEPKLALSNPSNASSAAFRQQIAAAKAEARKNKTKRESIQDVPTLDSSLDPQINADLFSRGPKDDKHMLRNRINAARMDGKLNIAALGLKDIPREVLGMYDAAALETSKVSWAEVVDLTRLNAADNDIEELSEATFPDVSVEDLIADDASQGNQFGGLEILDIHGNSLRSMPIGLRRLERLTTLNLARNKLENSALGVISQITSLKDLRLGHNALSGTLPATVCQLQHLDTLDLQANRLLSLPEAIRELVSLKVLNVSGNQITSLPMDALGVLTLTELDASSNALVGSLFQSTAHGEHAALRTFNVANNSLATLTFSDTLDLPHLHTLDVTNNHLTALPCVSAWRELVTLMAGDNKISELPEGFTQLQKLRNVNLAGNNLRSLDPGIARMEGLESLILASNPLREKKFLRMSAADIKRDLKARLESLEREDDETQEQESFHDAQDSLSTPMSSLTWQLQAGGKLDISARALADDVDAMLGPFLKGHEVRQLHLAMNKLTNIPPALRLGQDLKTVDLSGNPLRSDYLSAGLTLPVLQELNISKCNISTLDPLMTHLQAPALQSVNVSINRLTGPVPALRDAYPRLTTLLASDNRFTSVTAEALSGLSTVNLASNNIEQLPAEIGLLWDEGLRSLEVGSNAFRVPNYRILEKGTEATLRWCRDRLPAAYQASTVNGASHHDDSPD